MRVMIVDKDDSKSEELAEILTKNKHQNDIVSDSLEIPDLCKYYDYDVIVISDTIDNAGVSEIVGKTRRSGISTPIICLLSRYSTKTVVDSLDAGADDVMRASTDESEFIARSKAVSRRSRGHASSVISCGKVSIDMTNKKVYVEGREIPLTKKEYGIMELLMMRKGKMQTKDAIMDHLYNGMDEPEPKIIDVFVSKIRKKLTAALAGDVIQTHRGYGFSIGMEVS